MVSDLGPRKYKVKRWQKSYGLGALDSPVLTLSSHSSWGPPLKDRTNLMQSPQNCSLVASPASYISQSMGPLPSFPPQTSKTSQCPVSSSFLTALSLYLLALLPPYPQELSWRPLVLNTSTSSMQVCKASFTVSTIPLCK